MALLLVVTTVPAADPPLQSSLVPYAKRPNAPALVLRDLEGKTVSLASLKGKVVVVNFWATWCPPCRREFPSMEDLRAKMSGRALVILAVNEGETAEVIESFLSTLDRQPGFAVLLDLDGKAMQQWPVQGLPTTFILDKRGRLAYRAVGGREFDHADIVGRLDSLLVEK
jgi:thiol-disulfide isomerase/thioredoxin